MTGAVYVWHARIVLGARDRKLRKMAARGGATRRETMTHNDQDDSELTVFVTAHPDDESMFFVPTLRHYLTQPQSPQQQQSSQTTRRRRPPVWLVCLTTGNYDGLGAERAHELRHAAETVIGVDRTFLLDDPRHFPDHPRQAWDLDRVVAALVRTLNAGLQEGEDDSRLPENHVVGTLRLVTFDRDGVSGHVNHRDTFRAVQRLLTMGVRDDDGTTTTTDLLPGVRRVEAWSLETVHNPLAKYLPFREWIRLVLCWCGLVAPVVAASRSSDTETTTVTYRLLQPSLNWKAMAAHRSQFVWYRRLFVVFSCYTYVNRLRRMTGDDGKATTAARDTTTTTTTRQRQEKLD